MQAMVLRPHATSSPIFSSSWAVFHLNAKRVRICKIMSDGFAAKNQECLKKSPADFGIFFSLLEFLLFG